MEFLRTHISLLFFAGDRVYKIKRPVRFPFVDYSTRERRRHFCRLECDLNAALAPGVHLGVVEIARDRSGLLRIGGPGEPIEHAVEMRRLPAERMMDRLLARGEIDNDLLRRVVSVLLPFHAAAESGGEIDRHASAEALRGVLEGNLETAAAFAPPPLLALLRRDLLGFPLRAKALFEERIREGRIRDGHGDLHAGNICDTGEGIRIYDRIEFNPAFRHGDVAAEIAFLAMDLDARGFRAFADYFCHAYGEATGDGGLSALLTFYKSHRALIRAVVAHLRSGPQDLPAEGEAHDYLHLSVGYHLPPALVCVGGLPATGKSTVARKIATAMGAALLRSDVVRKSLLGIPLTRRWTGGMHEGPYAPDVTRRTYAHMREEAEGHLRAGRSVVVDATLPEEAGRDAFARLARECGCPSRFLLMEAPEATIRERMQARQAEADEVSDAGFEVWRQARREYEMPRSALRADGCSAPWHAVSLLLDSLATGRSAVC